MKIKRGCFIALLLIAAIIGGLILTPVVYRKLHPIAHQLPYKWDSYVRQDLRFEMVPITNVIVAVNAAIRDASGGAIPEAIKLDATPTRITKVDASDQLTAHMDQLIASFREHEKNMNCRGAEGFEGSPYTGYLNGHHSLGCTLVGPNECGLHWEAKEDALHVSRMPREMECRPYYVADELFVRMKQQRSENQYKVGAEPIVSALIYETGIHSWSIMLPEGPNSWGGEFRYNKVFKYVPELKVILALATPEEHAEAKKRLKVSGFWIDPQTEHKGHNNETQPIK